MPRTTDNQDLPENPKAGENKDGDTKSADRPDENNFSSDNLTGKKVDADPEKQSDRPDA